MQLHLCSPICLHDVDTVNFTFLHVNNVLNITRNSLLRYLQNLLMQQAIFGSTKVSHMKTLNCMLQAGPPSLHYYCAVVLHSCNLLATCRPLFQPRISLLSTYRQSGCVFEFLSHLSGFHLTFPRILNHCTGWPISHRTPRKYASQTQYKF